MVEEEYEEHYHTYNEETAAEQTQNSESEHKDATKQKQGSDNSQVCTNTCILASCINYCFDASVWQHF